MMVQLINYAYVAVFVLGLLVFADILFRFKRPQTLKLFLLGTTFALSSYGLGHVYCYHNGYNRLIMELPGLILMLSFTNFIYYLYENKIRRVVLLVCSFFLLTQISVSVYFNIVLKLGLDVDLYYHPDSAGLVKGLRITFMLIMVVMNTNLLMKIRDKYNQDNIYFEGLRKWTNYIVGLMVFSLILNAIKYSFPRIFDVCHFINMVAQGLCAIVILYRPDFLNRTPSKLSLLGLFSYREPEDISPDRFVTVFFNEMYYLREKASLQELASLMEAKSEALSQFIQRRFDMGFTDLVNKQRILYFIDLVKQGRAKQHTIEALARQSGFSSRQNMQRFFKKFHGGAPSDLINLIDPAED